MFIGLFFAKIFSRTFQGLAITFVLGVLFLLAIFQLVMLPSIFVGFSFSAAASIVSVIYITIIVSSIIMNRNILAKSFVIIKGKKIFKINFENNTFILLMALLALMIWVIFIYFIYSSHITDDDAFFVGTAVTTLATNSMFQYDPFTGLPYGEFVHWRYVFSPWNIFWSYLSKVFGIHPAIVARVIGPVYMLFFMIVSYYVIGRKLFSNHLEKTLSFICLVFVLIIFSGTASVSEGLWWLVMPNHGRVVLWIVLIPLSFYFAFEVIYGEPKRLCWISIIALVFAGMLLSSMSFVLLSICIGGQAITCFVIKRKLKDSLLMLLCCLPNIILAVVNITLR